MSALCPQPTYNPPDREARRFIRPRRTREAQAAKGFRAELARHVGTPSATQAALIEQAVQLRFRLAVMDRRFAETCEMSAHDSRVYLAWANSLSRILRQLGLKGDATRGPTLAEVIAAPAPPISAVQRTSGAPVTPPGTSDMGGVPPGIAAVPETQLTPAGRQATESL